MEMGISRIDTVLIGLQIRDDHNCINLAKILNTNQIRESRPFFDKISLFFVCLTLEISRSCKRNKTLFRSLLFWLAGEVSWLAVEVLSQCQK